MTFLNIDAMSVASKCSIIYYTPQGGGVFFLFKLEGCALKVGGVNPLGGLEISLLSRPYFLQRRVRNFGDRT